MADTGGLNPPGSKEPCGFKSRPGHCSLRSAGVEVPVVDLSGPSDRAAIELDRACSEVGFVQVVGHGLDAEVERAAWECAHQFFDLPERDNLEVAIPPGDAYG